MLKRSNRLKRKSFASRKVGKKSDSTLLSLRTFESKDGISKASFVVSKKVVKGAVERNQMKRKGYEAIRELVGILKRPTNLVFYLKKEALEASSMEISKSIRGILFSEGLL
jgi:ribonuclease P protein component